MIVELMQGGSKEDGSKQNEPNDDDKNLAPLSPQGELKG